MIEIKRHSGIYTLTAVQELPISIDEAWTFFSSPQNLVKMTPAHMNFQITSGQVDKTFQGQIITYKVSPIPGLRMNWVTEITLIEENKKFVDEQRFGPYSMWHHEHEFESTPNGVKMIDRVSYKIPLGILGHLAQTLFIERQLRGVFSYRERVLNELFGA